MNRRSLILSILASPFAGSVKAAPVVKDFGEVTLSGPIAMRQLADTWIETPRLFWVALDKPSFIQWSKDYADAWRIT